MKRIKTAAILLIVVAVALQLGGCMVGSYQARSVDIKNSPLVNPELLVKGTGDQALYRYQSPEADFLHIQHYNKIMIDPVMVIKDGELDKDELQNYQTLANNAYVYLTKELEKSHHIVKSPDPDTVRIQMAIIDADSAKPVRNTLSTLVPIGMGLSIIKYAATGKQSGVGEVTMEMKITDASTGKLLGAALDRRVGGKQLSQLWSSWHNADDALQYWAKRLSYILCDMRGTPTCEKP